MRHGVHCGNDLGCPGGTHLREKSPNARKARGATEVSELVVLGIRAQMGFRGNWDEYSPASPAIHEAIRAS